jgi:hypothetical protein
MVDTNRVKKAIALAIAIIFVHALSAHAAAPSTCAISGVLYDGAGNPVPNATIYFNSRSVQVVNGNTINPILKTSTTDVNGNLSTTALVQALFVQITICQTQGGGCSAPTTGYVPVAASSTFANLLAGQATATVTTLTGNLNASGFRIYNLGANTTLADALSQGQSSLNNLTTATGNYAMGGFKLTGLSAGSNSGDSLAYGLNSLNNLAAATGNYAMGGNTLTGLAAPTAAGEPLIYSTSTNTSSGFQTLLNVTSGTGNSAFGYLSLVADTTGINNSGFGRGTLESNTTGSNNVAVGYNALNLFNDTGSSSDFNVAIGNQAGVSDTTGALNIFVGRGATGFGPTTGSSNIDIGNLNVALFPTGSNQLDIADIRMGVYAFANLPACAATATASPPTVGVGATASIIDNDSACAINGTPAHATCTPGTNCYTCQIQCAETGSTTYAWTIY